jgi:outer membrane protein TolC
VQFSEAAAPANSLIQQVANSQVDWLISGPHGVDHYIQIALAQNPTISAAQRKVAAQNEVRPQVTSLDDPMLSDTLFPITDNAIQTAAGRAPNTIMLSQKFPWQGKLSARGKLADADTQMALRELAEARLAVTEDVRLAYYEVASSQRIIQITESSRDLLIDLLAFAEARFRTGGSQQDVIRAQLEIDNLTNRLIKLRRSLAAAQADLAATMNASQDERPTALDNPPGISVPGELDRLYQTAAECRPELQKWLHAVVKAEHLEELACLDYYPDVTAGLSWQIVTDNNAISPVANSRDNVGLTVGLNLPIWRDKLDAGVREAQHRRMEMARRYDASRDETFRRIRRLIVQVRALDEQIKLYRREKNGIIARGKQVLRISTTDYRVNKVDFQQIIDNWNNLLMFEIQAIQLESNLAQSLASLERVVGCEITQPVAQTANADGP